MSTAGKRSNPVEILQQLEHDGPIDMVNHFRFRETALYSPDSGEPTRSGREAFALYAQSLGPVLEAAGGCVRIWRGKVHFEITSEGADTWDEMMVVRYPSKAALLGLFANPAFAAIHHHRAAALADSRTYICIPG
jgi:uncharacterized protein (DUF1330 family)